MKQIQRIIIGMILIIIFSTGTIKISDEIAVTRVEAAVKTPEVKINKQILYVGFKTYTIELSGVSEKASIIYKSDDPHIAQVNTKGVIKPIAKGTADIDAAVKQDGRTYHLKIHITVKTPSIRLDQRTDYMNVGDSSRFTAKTEGMDDKVTFSVSDPSIAVISKTGKVTAKKGGYVTIYAKAGGKQAKGVVSVGTNRLGTFSKEVTCYNNKTIWITADDYMKGEKLTAVADNPKIAGFVWGKRWYNGKLALTLKPKAVGKTTITITSDKSNDKLVLSVTAQEKQKSVKELTAVGIYEKCRPATVELSSVTNDGTSMGSGFFIGEGTIITNYHVIEGTQKITVKTYDDTVYDVTAILGYDKKLDLAVLKINAKNKSLLISQDPVKVGADIYTIGSPFGLTGTMTKGMVSSASRVIDSVKYVQFDAPISKGNSGGPLLNSYGEAIGINTMYYRNGQSLNFAVNISEVQKINTNHPLTLSEYHTNYELQKQLEFQSTMILENPEVSQNIASCQNITSGVGVGGTIMASESGDFYTFTIPESGWFVARVFLNNSEDTKNLNYKIYDVNLYLKASAVKYETDNSENLACYLTPGQYYIRLSREDGSPLNNIYYLFSTSQIYDY